MAYKYILALIVMGLVASSTGDSALFASGSDAATSAVSSMANAQGMMEKLNVNTASIESLSNIPGLSPKIGEAISAYRDANGTFKSLSELVNVEGIDAGLLENIKPLLSI